MANNGNEDTQIKQLLRIMDAKLASVMTTDMLIDFFSLITDDALDASDFSMQVGMLFKGKPELFTQVEEAIGSSVQLKALIQLDNKKSLAIRHVIFEYFNHRMDEELQFDLADYDEGEQGFAQAEKDRHTEKTNLEDKINDLKKQYQALLDQEMKERKIRQARREEEREALKKSLQFEYKTEVVDRKIRKEKLRRQIAALTKKLQEKHDNAIRAQKIIRLRKAAKMKLQASAQADELRLYKKKREEEKQSQQDTKPAGIEQLLQFVNFRD